ADVGEGRRLAALARVHDGESGALDLARGEWEVERPRPRRGRKLEQPVEVVVVASDLLGEESPSGDEDTRDLGGDERLVAVRDELEARGRERQPPSRLVRRLLDVIRCALVADDRDAQSAQSCTRDV